MGAYTADDVPFVVPTEPDNGRPRTRPGSAGRGNILPLGIVGGEAPYIGCTRCVDTAQAAAYGHHKCIVALLESGIPWNPDTALAAAKAGNGSIVAYAIGRMPPDQRLVEVIIEKCAESGHNIFGGEDPGNGFPVLRGLVNFINRRMVSGITIPDLFNISASFGAEWLMDEIAKMCDTKWPDSYSSDVVLGAAISALRGGHPETIAGDWVERMGLTSRKTVYAEALRINIDPITLYPELFTRVSSKRVVEAIRATAWNAVEGCLKKIRPDEWNRQTVHSVTMALGESDGSETAVKWIGIIAEHIADARGGTTKRGRAPSGGVKFREVYPISPIVEGLVAAAVSGIGPEIIAVTFRALTALSVPHRGHLPDTCILYGLFSKDLVEEFKICYKIWDDQPVDRYLLINCVGKGAIKCLKHIYPLARAQEYIRFHLSRNLYATALRHRAIRCYMYLIEQEGPYFNPAPAYRYVRDSHMYETADVNPLALTKNADTLRLLKLLHMGLYPCSRVGTKALEQFAELLPEHRWCFLKGAPALCDHRLGPVLQLQRQCAAAIRRNGVPCPELFPRYLSVAIWGDKATGVDAAEEEDGDVGDEPGTEEADAAEGEDGDVDDI